MSFDAPHFLLTSLPVDLPWVLLPCAPSAIQGDDFVTADASLADWTHLSVGSGLQPLLKIRIRIEFNRQVSGHKQGIYFGGQVQAWCKCRECTIK